jgi:hypothetical protein
VSPAARRFGEISFHQGQQTPAQLSPSANALKEVSFAPRCKTRDFLPGSSLGGSQ